ncbi:hypothetical protein RIF29_14984 [Crotalaria pallida]|uniref:Uncharacterized protein n=1 Tax=Crotalaria pallida TaxID=3830 RepID=A0AAN9FCQ1_CROPI
MQPSLTVGRDKCGFLLAMVILNSVRANSMVQKGYEECMLSFTNSSLKVRESSSVVLNQALSSTLPSVFNYSTMPKPNKDMLGKGRRSRARVLILPFLLKQELWPAGILFFGEQLLLLF